MRNVIVTGGSRGLGLGISRRLAEVGFRVVAIARKESSELTCAIKEAEAAGSGSLQFVPFDLAEIEAIPELIKGIRKTFGKVYGLVNNAGISAEGLLATMHNSHLEQLVRLNTLSPMVMTKYVVRAMMSDGGGGRIVNMASIIATTGYSGLAAYAATKASMNGFTRSLAREVGRSCITVNSVAPGFVETDLTHGMSEEQKQQIVRRSPLKRLAEIEDIANAVEFLLSDKAKSITGTVMTVDAGSTA